MFPLSNLLRRFVRIGTLKIIDAGGKEHVFSGEPGPSATLTLSKPSLYYKIFFNPGLYFGEAYMDGSLRFESGSIRDFMELYFLNEQRLYSHPFQSLVRRTAIKFRRFQQNNSITRSRRKIAHHYDIGNAFYRLFLDEDMQYSCAYFERPDNSLEEAQQNKKRLVAAKLDLKPNLRILDIGSGWGGLALYLASLDETIEVLGVTLSQEQYQMSNERARKAGLDGRVRFELRDYRELDGTFDRIVSVGMFEHVGVHYYKKFFDKVGDLLSEDGIALLHAIGHKNSPEYTSAWLRKYIFPGGYTPALSEVFAATERSGLWVDDVEILRLHYSYTLREWNRRFRENYNAVEEMFDKRFCRMWEFFLTISEELFRSGSRLVFQMQISHKRDAMPITRDYIGENQQKLRELGV